MRLSVVLWAVVWMWMSASTLTAQPQGDPVTVRVTGQAPADLPNAREAAIEAGLRTAVETVGGIQIKAVAEAADMMLVGDAIFAQAEGFVERYRVIEENPNDQGVYAVRLEATVRRGDVNDSVLAFRALLERKGRPTFAILARANGELAPRDETVAIQRTLRERGIRVIDLEMLGVNRERQIELLDRRDNDPQLAAQVRLQIPADILVIVDIDFEKLEPRVVQGLRDRGHRARYAPRLQVIRVDTAEFVGGDLIDREVRAADESSLRRAGVEEALLPAMQEAMRQVARSWLDEVGTGGGNVIVKLQRVDQQRTFALMENMRKVPGVKAVNLPSVDPKGESEMRIATNATAADVFAVLQKLDPNVQLVSIQGNVLTVK